MPPPQLLSERQHRLSLAIDKDDAAAIRDQRVQIALPMPPDAPVTSVQPLVVDPPSQSAFA